MANRHYRINDQKSLQQQRGFTLLDQVGAITLFAITSSTAATYMQDWLQVSEQQVLAYSTAAAESSMMTHQQWQQAAGRNHSIGWQDVITIKGIEQEIKGNQLTLSSLSSQHCQKLELSEGSIKKTNCSTNSL